MATNPNSRAIQPRTLMLAQTGVLAAVMYVLNFSGLGLIKFGLFSLTTLTIPVIIGAMTAGKLPATLLGGLFGVLVTISPDAALFLSVNPALTIFFLIVLRGFGWGFLCGLLFEVFSKLDKTKIWSYGATGLSCAFLNTALFVGFTPVLFGSNPQVREAFGVDGISEMFAGLLAIVGTQAIIEFFACAIVTAAIAKPVTMVLHKSAR